MTGNGTHDAVVKLELSEPLLDPRDRPGHSAPTPGPFFYFREIRLKYRVCGATVANGSTSCLARYLKSLSIRMLGNIVHTTHE